MEANKMIEIAKYKAGTCGSCKQRPAEYSIKGPKEEWDLPNAWCQLCMVGLVKNNDLIRSIILLQAGTRE
jgi:hypothetical protein